MKRDQRDSWKIPVSVGVIAVLICVGLLLVRLVAKSGAAKESSGTSVTMDWCAPRTTPTNFVWCTSHEEPELIRSDSRVGVWSKNASSALFSDFDGGNLGLDNFHRPNGALGPNWLGTTLFMISGNQLEPLGAIASEAYWSAPFSANQQASVRISNIDANEHGLILKAQGSNPSSVDGSMIIVAWQATLKTVQVWRVLNGVFSQQDAAMPVVFASGDVLGAQLASDGTLTVTKNGLVIGAPMMISPAWPYNASGGRIGVWSKASLNARFDDFDGGNLVSNTAMASLHSAVTRTTDLLGSGWLTSTAVLPSTSFQILLKPSPSTITSEIYLNTPVSDDQHASVRLLAIDENGEQGLILKAITTTAAFAVPNSITDTMIVVDYQVQNHVVQVWGIADGAFQQLGSNIASTFAAGDVLGAEARASGTLSVFKNGGLIGTVDISSWPYYMHGRNLHSYTEKAGSDAVSWYSTTNGGTGSVDRNDSQYSELGAEHPKQSQIDTAIQAVVTDASADVPARNGSTQGDHYLTLAVDTTFAYNQLTNRPPDVRDAGVFLARTTRNLGTGVDLITPNPGGLYYSAWYLFPQVYQNTTKANQNLMVMEFMSVDPNVSNPDGSVGEWRTPWSIHLDTNVGVMSYRVDERSGSLGSKAKSSMAILTPHFQVQPKPIPIGKWTHLEVFYKYAPATGGIDTARGSGAGQVVVYQDGVPIFQFDNVATTAPATPTTSPRDYWMVTAYAHLTTPSLLKFYVDDAAISKTQLGLSQ